MAFRRSLIGSCDVGVRLALLGSGCGVDVVEVTAEEEVQLFIDSLLLVVVVVSLGKIKGCVFDF